MNKTISLAAIAMFAVIMGMGAFAPAMGAPGNPNSAATTAVCHYDLVEDDLETEVDESEESAWIVLHTSSQGATNGHLKHNDMVIGEGDGEITAQDCTDQTLPVPEPEE
jgi:hypothetical protein